MGARRDARHGDEQRPARIFLQPFRLRPARRTDWSTDTKLERYGLAGAQGTDIGNVGRNVLRGPRQTNVDFSVIKRFPFGEAKSVEFRAEFFNLFNHVNFANPDQQPQRRQR